jgi:hypothetical protein
MPVDIIRDGIISECDLIREQLSTIKDNPGFEIILIDYIESPNHTTPTEKILLITDILNSGIIGRNGFQTDEIYWQKQIERLNQISTHGVFWRK